MSVGREGEGRLLLFFFFFSFGMKYCGSCWQQLVSLPWNSWVEMFGVLDLCCNGVNACLFGLRGSVLIRTWKCANFRNDLIELFVQVCIRFRISRI